MSDLAVPLLMNTTPNTPWRPRALGMPVLIFFTLICVCLFIANETIISLCDRHGCRVFGHTDDGSLPAASRVMYSALPTILGVALSLGWIRTHHDIARLEPFFQMSTKYGAKASTSLFLEYPYDIMFLLPIKALRNGHYVVALSSAILVLMNFVLVPLVPSTFDFSVIRSFTDLNATRASNTTAEQITADFTYLAYENAWGDNGTLSPFMTPEYALLPVEPVDRNMHSFAPTEQWSVNTTLFEAELQCVDALRVSLDNWGNNTALPYLEIFNIDNTPVRFCDALALELGAKYNDSQCPEAAYTAFMTPWTSLFRQLEAPEGQPVSYMFAWAFGPSTPPPPSRTTSPAPTNITAIFCTPIYYAQTVNATVSMPSGDVIRSDRRGAARTKINPPRGFDGILDGNVLVNYTGEVLVQGLLGPSYPVAFGYPPDRIVRVHDDLSERFGKARRPVKPPGKARASDSNVFMTRSNSLAAFSLYSQNNSTLSTLGNSNTLKNTIEKALKLLYSFAITTEAASTGMIRTESVTVQKDVPAAHVAVNKRWSLALRIGLPVISVMAAILCYLLKDRTCHLKGEPNTLSGALRLLEASPALCAVMKNSEYRTQHELMLDLDGNDLHFRMDLDGSAIRVFEGGHDGAEEFTEEEATKVKRPTDHVVQKDHALIPPTFVSLGCLVSYIILLVALIATYRVSQDKAGFPIPGGRNSFLSKLLFSYLPMAAGALAETLLVALGAVKCMMAPYKPLLAKNGAKAKALNINYYHIPPQFMFFSPPKKGRRSLIVLSFTILLSNTLPVFLSSIFSITSYIPRVPTNHDILMVLPRDRQEMYSQLNRNITSGYSPSWTTGSYYIDPPFVVAPSGEATYNTRGFGVNATCTIVPDDRIVFPCSQTERYMMNSYYKNVNCTNDRMNQLTIISPCGSFNGSMSISNNWSGTCLDGVVKARACQDQIFSVWVQNKRYATADPGTEDDFHFVVLNCTLRDTFVDLRATVHDGRVLSVADVVPVLEANTNISLARSFINVMKNGSLRDNMIFGNHPIQNINALMARLNESVVQSNDTHVPSGPVAMETFESVLERLFPLLVRLYASDIFGVQWSQPGMDRAYVETLGFGGALGVTLFSFFVIVKLSVERSAGEVKGHLPWNLAGMYSHLYPSNARDDVGGGGAAGLQETSERDKAGVRVSEEYRYLYGDYQDESGRHHGVYRVPFSPTPVVDIP